MLVNIYKLMPMCMSVYVEKQNSGCIGGKMTYIRVTHKFQHISNMWDCLRNNRYKVKLKTGSTAYLILIQACFISNMCLIRNTYLKYTIHRFNLSHPLKESVHSVDSQGRTCFCLFLVMKPEHS